MHVLGATIDKHLDNFSRPPKLAGHKSDYASPRRLSRSNRVVRPSKDPGQDPDQDIFYTLKTSSITSPVNLDVSIASKEGFMQKPLARTS